MPPLPPSRPAPPTPSSTCLPVLSTTTLGREARPAWTSCALTTPIVEGLEGREDQEERAMATWGWTPTTAAAADLPAVETVGTTAALLEETEVVLEEPAPLEGMVDLRVVQG